MERRSGQKCYSRKLVLDPRFLHLDLIGYEQFSQMPCQ